MRILPEWIKLFGGDRHARLPRLVARQPCLHQLDTLGEQGPALIGRLGLVGPSSPAANEFAPARPLCCPADFGPGFSAPRLTVAPAVGEVRALARADSPLLSPGVRAGDPKFAAEVETLYAEPFDARVIMPA